MKIIFKPQTEWLPPQDFPDLSKYDEIAVDLETKDPNLNERMGSGSVVGVCLLYTSPSPRDGLLSRMPSSA